MPLPMTSPGFLNGSHPLAHGMVLCLLPLPGQSWLDFSGRGNHGVLAGTPPPGWRPAGLEFAGGGAQRAQCGSDDSLDNLVQKTVSVRAYIRSPGEGGSFGRLLDKAQSNGWRLSMSGAKFNVFHQYTGGGLNCTTVNSFAVPGVHHVVFTFDTADFSRFRIWVNGRWEGVGSASPTGSYPDDAAGNLLIGNNSALNRTFDGILEHAMIWRRILGDAEVRTLCENPHAMAPDGHAPRQWGAAPPLFGR